MRRRMTLAERPTLELTLERERRRSFEVFGEGAEAAGVVGDCLMVLTVLYIPDWLLTVLYVPGRPCVVS